MYTSINVNFIVGRHLDLNRGKAINILNFKYVNILYHKITILHTICYIWTVTSVYSFLKVARAQKIGLKSTYLKI